MDSTDPRDARIAELEREQEKDAAAINTWRAERDKDKARIAELEARLLKLGGVSTNSGPDSTASFPRGKPLPTHPDDLPEPDPTAVRLSDLYGAGRDLAGVPDMPEDAEHAALLRVAEAAEALTAKDDEYEECSNYQRELMAIRAALAELRRARAGNKGGSDG